MQKILLLGISILFFTGLQAQTTGKVSRKLDLSSRPADHLMLQFAADNWSNMPDSIDKHRKGFSKGFNAYIMLDKPFKTNPKFSLGIGIGVGTSNIRFKNMNVDIKSTTTKLPFTAVDSTNHFKKYKLSLGYLEVPLEFRFSSDPLHSDKSLKFAIGGKVGTLINAHTKGKDLQSKNNTLISSYIQKENSKKFFNGTRFMGTARVGYGIFSLYGSYQLNNVLKDAAGPPMRLVEIGFALSGL
jgi:hypothetical protein